MQNCYVGDVGDFGKYALLKALSGPDLRLGVLWYLVPDQHDGGGHTAYLDPTPGNNIQYRNCAVELYDGLQAIVRANDRKVQSIRERGVLPASTIFYEEQLSFVGIPRTREGRVAERRQWAERGRMKTWECELVFADPDMGLEVPSTQRHHRRGPKYAFFDELLPYSQAGKSLIIYQQTGHTNARSRVTSRLRDIVERLGCGSPFALLYHRGTSRSFLVAPATSHGDVLLARASCLVQGPWSRHFDLIR